MTILDAIAPFRTRYDRALAQQDREYPAYGEAPEKWPRSHLGQTLETLRRLDYVPPTPEQKAEQRTSLNALFDSFNVEWAKEKQAGGK